MSCTMPFVALANACTMSLFPLSFLLSCAEGQGWETFTDAVIRELNTRNKGLVFLLWGKPAETKCKAVDKSKHTVLTAPHPSPLSASRGWFGCRHFSLANEALKKRGKPEIDWQL